MATTEFVKARTKLRQAGLARVRRSMESFRKPAYSLDAKTMRPGKTAEDKRTGAWFNRFDNRNKA